ncbi:hypothetical protein COR50_20690 [Chitinophaga caeni]|uniref:Uncharacterized protein n=1 Tax=Chitinophaga caeni TaxID=2029983 RepID=A0A291QZM3_9BACT|nr:hypothetical protein [Chitinophaga caeni]ATL49400.1 hypothetical protein COR50_20690 [Chitinophaga caeni]
MKFVISLRLFEITLSETIRTNTEKVVSELTNRINTYIGKQDYGDSILEYEIILYVVNMPKDYEHLYRGFKPKYVEHKLLTNKHTGEKFEMSKYFNYSVKIEGALYHKFISFTNDESTRILALEILKSLNNLDTLLKKVKDFDKERFKSDMEQFFRTQNLL